MAKAKMIVLVRATDGRTEELDNWYETTHVPDLLGVPGVKSIERFDIGFVLHVPEGSPKWDYAGIYEIEADDVGAVLQEMGRRMGSGEIANSPSLDSANTLAMVVSLRTSRSAG